MFQDFLEVTCIGPEDFPIHLGHGMLDQFMQQVEFFFGQLNSIHFASTGLPARDGTATGTMPEAAVS
jgi:hypothetical protein